MADREDDDTERSRDDPMGRKDDRGRRDRDSASETGGDGEKDEDGDDGSDDSGGEDEADKKPSLFRRPLFWVIFVVVAAIVLIGGTLWFLHARKFESTDDAFVDSHVVRLAPDVGGRLVQVADVDNRHVKAGRLLAVIEPNGRDAQLGEAQANVVQAEAQYRQALAEVTSSAAAADQARAQARAPLADAERARADLARYEALKRLDGSAVAAQQLDQARASARNTAAQAAAAQQAIRNAEAQVAVSRRAAVAARAGIGARRAQVAQANTTIGNLRLVAPVSGQVTNRQVNVGSYVAAGTQLMAIVPDRIWVTANFKETQLTKMRPGQAVTIRVDAYPDVQFHGRVDSFQRAAGQAFAVLPPQNATGNFVKVVQRVPVRIEFVLRDPQGHPYPDPRRWSIGPGMSVEPTVQVLQ